MSKRIFRGDVSAEVSSLSESLQELNASRSKDKVAIQHPGENIFREAFSEGYQAGFAKGIADSQEQNQLRLDLFSKELSSLIDRIESAMNLWFQKAETELSSLAADIAVRVVAEELAIRPSAILAIAREALLEVTESSTVHIRVNPFDLHTLEDNKESLINASSSVRNFTIAGDESLTRGSVVIEGENGIVHATVESQVESILREAA